MTSSGSLISIPETNNVERSSTVPYRAVSIAFIHHSVGSTHRHSGRTECKCCCSANKPTDRALAGGSLLLLSTICLRESEGGSNGGGEESGEGRAICCGSRLEAISNHSCWSCVKTSGSSSPPPHLPSLPLHCMSSWPFSWKHYLKKQEEEEEGQEEQQGQFDSFLHLMGAGLEKNGMALCG